MCAVSSARLRRLLDFVSLAFGRKSPPSDGTNTCPTVPPMRQTPSVAVPPSLALRAYRLHNRNQKGAETYLRLHQTLAKGVLKYE